MPNTRRSAKSTDKVGKEPVEKVDLAITGQKRPAEEALVPMPFEQQVDMDVVPVNKPFYALLNPLLDLFGCAWKETDQTKLSDAQKYRDERLLTVRKLEKELEQDEKDLKEVNRQIASTNAEISLHAGLCDKLVATYETKRAVYDKIVRSNPSTEKQKKAMSTAELDQLDAEHDQRKTLAKMERDNALNAYEEAVVTKNIVNGKTPALNADQNSMNTKITTVKSGIEHATAQLKQAKDIVSKLEVQRANAIYKGQVAKAKIQRQDTLHNIVVQNPRSEVVVDGQPINEQTAVLQQRLSNLD